MATTKRTNRRTAKQAATPAKPRKKPAAHRAKKAVAAPASRKRADKATAAAAPLLARAPKKVGKVTAKLPEAVKPNAPYQPKTEAAPLASASRASTMPAFDPLALARPWMRLGLQMTMSNFALQARLVQAAIDLPSTATAIKQGSAAYKGWLAMLGRAQPAQG
jgi:hypothetical protein